MPGSAGDSTRSSAGRRGDSRAATPGADGSSASAARSRRRAWPGLSAQMVRRIRIPSRIACRLLCPEIRGRSKLGISHTVRPALAARMFRVVSTSKPLPYGAGPTATTGDPGHALCSSGRQSAQKAL